MQEHARSGHRGTQREQQSAAKEWQDEEDRERADLVLEGGGVQGIALAGAVSQLAEAGYRFQRAAGTSAGAVMAAVVAAMEAAGEPLDRLGDLVREIDYEKFTDPGLLARWAGPLQPVVNVASLVLESGIYEGDYLRTWVERILARRGVRTFADLRLPPDEGSDLPSSHRYRLVVTASDLSRQRFVRLPWDYPDYGLDPDEQLVADAVRASASIPFYFEPVTLDVAGGGAATLVDGGLYSSYPIAIFDREDDNPPRWPTFGVRLSGRPAEPPPPQPVHGPVSLALAIAGSLYGAWDAVYVGDPCARARSIFVDTAGVSPLDFGLSEAQQERLFRAGKQAVAGFLADWDFAEYVRVCRRGVL